MRVPERRPAQDDDGLVWSCDVCGRVAEEFTPAHRRTFLRVWPCGHFNPGGMASHPIDVASGGSVRVDGSKRDAL